ncbi:hypothetical protein H9P43_009361 [Blastocladiella emersonii ATCC 22665]|nr:hypothetical protein H9P43_009361 [Blastocladiella emersonii ATCC 22665]
MQASEYDPKEYLAELDKYGVNFFEVGRNVACIDMGPLDNMRYVTVERIRAAVCKLRPLKVRETYKELVALANGDVEMINENYKTTKAMIESRQKDKVWHQRRMRTLAVATACTVWVPILDQLSGIGMGIAINHSGCKLAEIKEEIKELKEVLLSVKNQKKDAAERLARVKSLIQEASKANEKE